MQTTIASCGRLAMFLMMKPSDYLILISSDSMSRKNYKYLTILSKLFFDFELLEKLPRKAFLPWESRRKYSSKTNLSALDEDKIYLTRFIWKKELHLPIDQLLPFYFFVKQLFKAGSKIIPTLENWVPGCGENIILPKIHHDVYYEDIGIHTEFRELTPHQILEVFREMSAHPSYAGSPFLDMVEAELIKNETVETSSNIISPDLEKNIIESIEIKSEITD
ncbi:hypothetical protein HHI36_001042 [Cryptolaemus montrouzieri]|uniref:Uncharacterized protein n=1 Tax=Cryptolaemus montrouzieri TaxID=559131 RepID=A0ABD2P6G9_9CUCU